MFILMTPSNGLLDVCHISEPEPPWNTKTTRFLVSRCLVTQLFVDVVWAGQNLGLEADITDRRLRGHQPPRR
jgi:hypothetical protein